MNVHSSSKFLFEPAQNPHVYLCIKMPVFTITFTINLRWPLDYKTTAIITKTDFIIIDIYNCFSLDKVHFRGPISIQIDDWENDIFWLICFVWLAHGLFNLSYTLSHCERATSHWPHQSIHKQQKHRVHCDWENTILIGNQQTNSKNKKRERKVQKHNQISKP